MTLVIGSIAAVALVVDRSVDRADLGEPGRLCRVTAQTIAYVVGDLTPATHSYFEARVPAQAASYRVLVQYDWIQRGGGTTHR